MFAPRSAYVHILLAAVCRETPVFCKEVKMRDYYANMHTLMLTLYHLPCRFTCDVEYNKLSGWPKGSM
jgi:hypothetical protein